MQYFEDHIFSIRLVDPADILYSKSTVCTLISGFI